MEYLGVVGAFDPGDGTKRGQRGLMIDHALILDNHPFPALRGKMIHVGDALHHNVGERS